MSAEKPKVENMCIAKTQWFNRAVGEHACTAVKQDTDQPGRQLRCPVRAIVHDDIDLQATQEANRAVGYTEDDQRYTQLHRTTFERDAALVEQAEFASDCLAPDDHLPRTGFSPYGRP